MADLHTLPVITSALRDAFVVSGSINPDIGRLLLDGTGSSALGSSMQPWNQSMSNTVVDRQQLDAISSDEWKYSVWSRISKNVSLLGQGSAPAQVICETRRISEPYSESSRDQFGEEAGTMALYFEDSAILSWKAGNFNSGDLPVQLRRVPAEESSPANDFLCEKETRVASLTTGYRNFVMMSAPAYGHNLFDKLILHPIITNASAMP